MADGDLAEAVPLTAGANAIAFLKRHPGFSSLSNTELRTIIDMSRIDQVAGDAVLFHQGEHGDFAYLVLSGSVNIEVETNLGRVIVAVVKAGGMVGEIGAFAERPRTATVRTLTASELLRIDRKGVTTLLANHPAAAMSIIGDLGDRLLGLNGTIATLTQATTALANGEFRPEMLQSLKDQAERISQFAEVFEQMANEITHKRIHNQEMQTAAEIQRSFLPKPLPPGSLGERCTLSASMVPAKDVGGDFYDYFMLGPDRLGFAIGDVSGKGVPAAMFMSVSRTMLKAIASAGGSAGEIMTHLNDVLTEEGRESMFVTLFFAILDLASGAVEYVAAGHDEVYLLPRSGPCRQIIHTGPAIGLFEGVSYRTERLTLAGGDAMLLATDGVTEAFNPAGEMFEKARVEALLDATADRTADSLVAAVNHAVDEFADGAERSDDTTCLAVSYCGGV